MADVEALVKAIETAGTIDPEKVRDALAKVEVRQPVWPDCFNENGQIDLPQTVIQVQDDKLVPIYGAKGFDRRSRNIRCRPGTRNASGVGGTGRRRDLLAQILVNGILLGGLYAVMALGLALVWGVLNIVNLAHGAFIMLGAYACYYLFTDCRYRPVSRPADHRCRAVRLGYAVQRGILNLIVRAPMFNTLLITFGLEVVLTYLAQLAFSAPTFAPSTRPMPAPISLFGTDRVPVARLLAFGVALVLTVALWLFLVHTRLGRAIRATAQNLVAARLYGVEPRHLYAMTFGIGVALAGAAGGLYGTVSQINPYIGAALTAKSFAISIIGGLDNPLGVIVGGLFLGIVESLTALYIGPTYADVASFGVLVLVLIVRPNGLLGRTA